MYNLQNVTVLDKINYINAFQKIYFLNYFIHIAYWQLVSIESHFHNNKATFQVLFVLTWY